MCCQKASYASLAIACSPTASANSYYPWHAPCWPPRAASRCHSHRRRTATSGTVPGAEKPCASSSASPLHSSISQALIPHDCLHQSARSACSTHVCEAVCAQLAVHPQGHGPRHPKAALLHPADAPAQLSPSSPAKNTPPKITRPSNEHNSISIISTWITANPAPAASFSPANRKRLALSSEAYLKTHLKAFPMLRSGYSPTTKPS